MKPTIDNPMEWKLKEFGQLNTEELYEILKLRAEVFVVEQNCVYQDLDGADKKCYHLSGWINGNTLAAYARILPAGTDTYDKKENRYHGSLGRVVVAPEFRGIGHQLVEKALKAYDETIGKDVPCIIHAQAHLKSFYESHGFRQSGEICLIDGIKHMEMTRIITG